MKLVQVNIAATEVMLFTPLPQMHMTNILLDNNICSEKEIVTLEYVNAESLSKMFFDISEHKPDIVAFSAYMWNFKMVDQLSQSLKDWSNNKCWIVWGGPHVSEDPLNFLKKYKSSIDFLVTWYGEKPIMQITKSWKANNGDLNNAKENLVSDKVKGIYFHGNFKNNLLSKDEKESLMLSQRKQNNVRAIEETKIYNQFGGDAYGLRAGDFIPLTELAEAYQYTRLPQHIKNNISERVFMLESYRGCPFSCSCCLWGVASKKIDYLSVERMKREFSTMVNYGVRHFNLADAGFGLRKDRDAAFLKHIMDVQSQVKHKINLSGYWFWQTLNDEMLEIMKNVIDMGIMGQIDIGIQTFNPAVTKAMRRSTNYEKFNDTIKRIKKFNIPFQMDLILGLPGDDFKGFLGSVKNVMTIEPNKFQTFPLCILPGSDYDRRRKELGIKTMKGSKSMDIDSIIETASFPREEIKKALRVESFFYLTYTLRLLNNTFKYLAKVSKTSFYAVSLGLYDWSIKNERLILQLTTNYYESLYENRHVGRKNLDNFLFKNFGEIHEELQNFIKSYLYQNKKEKFFDELKEFLAFEFLLFPKKFQTVYNTESFKNYIEEFMPDERSLVANFMSKNLYQIYFSKRKNLYKDKYVVTFTEPISNFREGGISTQYNFWKWKISLERKLSLAV